MLTGFTFCIPIKNNSAEEVITAWRNHISFPFGVCRKLLSDNGMEFKNELFNIVAEQLGVERKIYTPPYCNVKDYLSVMKILCIRLYRRMVETETMMNSFVYIRIMVKYIFTNIYIIGHVFDSIKALTVTQPLL